MPFYPQDKNTFYPLNMKLSENYKLQYRSLLKKISCPHQESNCDSSGHSNDWSIPTLQSRVYAFRKTEKLLRYLFSLGT